MVKSKGLRLTPKQQNGGAFVDFVSVRDMSGSRFASIAIMMCIVIAILAAVLYIVYLIKTSTFSTTEIIKGTIKVSDSTNTPKAVTLPSSTTSTSTYTFWIYLTSFVPQGANSEPGLIWMGFTPSGSSTGTSSTKPAVASPKMTSASPIVSIDSATNRMYMSFYLNAPPSSTDTNSIKLSNLKPSSTNYTGDMRADTNKKIKSNYVTIPVDYVPLQRWIQYTVIVSSSAITIYQDASIYAVRSASDLAPWDGTLTRPLFNTGSPPTSIMTFANPDSSKGPVIADAVQQQNLYLANMKYFNYGLNQADIQSLYSKGPQTTGTWYSWLNLPGYRLQWPIAKVSDSSSLSATDNNHDM